MPLLQVVDSLEGADAAALTSKFNALAAGGAGAAAAPAAPAPAPAAPSYVEPAANGEHPLLQPWLPWCCRCAVQKLHPLQMPGMLCNISEAWQICHQPIWACQPSAVTLCPCAGDLQERLRQLVNQQPIMLFMKVRPPPRLCPCLAFCFLASTSLVLLAWLSPHHFACLPALSGCWSLGPIALPTCLPACTLACQPATRACYVLLPACPPACAAARCIRREARRLGRSAWVMRKAHSPRPLPRANTRAGCPRRKAQLIQSSLP